jgi:hypothetical protein
LPAGVEKHYETRYVFKNIWCMKGDWVRLWRLWELSSVLLFI